jgi:hypothetical protein
MSLARIAIALMLSGCAHAEKGVAGDPRAECCAECRKAASQDPRAMDLALLPCTDWIGEIVNGEAAISKECSAFFRDRPLMLQDCRP